MAKITEQRINKVDQKDMRKLLVNFHEQWKEAMDLTSDLSLNIDKDRVQTICFGGMGGSAIGADLIKAYSANECSKPIFVNRHYNIPNWVDENTLFISCSYSGNTEETLSAFNQAQERGAQIIAVTSGGTLLNEARKKGYDTINIPGGLPPRAALGYSFIPLYRIFQELGYIEAGTEALDDTARYLEQRVPLLADLNESSALTLATDLHHTLPVVYSDSTFMEPVNLRWRGQFEENAKTLGYGNFLPELNHNEIVGWDKIAHLTGRLVVIMLKDQADHPKVQQRMNITKELIEQHAASVHVLNTNGEHRLTRMFSLIQLGDWVSFYLSVLNDADPTPVAKIDLLKSKLAEL